MSGGVLRRISPKALALAGLAAAVFVSAIAVVYAKHESRKLFVELQGLQQKRDAMNVEWGQLQLEQSTWATHGRIERVARNKLGMVVPAHENVVIVKP
ncbi:MAG TPA: cell division protein FtsL [Gammaproteobacteria bacterium]|nr:cell division protein FtsL [Gammaproteobacteria bacterium]